MAEPSQATRSSSVAVAAAARLSATRSALWAAGSAVGAGLESELPSVQPATPAPATASSSTGMSTAGGAPRRRVLLRGGSASIGVVAVRFAGGAALPRSAGLGCEVAGRPFGACFGLAGAGAGAAAVEVLLDGAWRLRAGASAGGARGAPFRATGFWRRTGCVASAGRRRKRPLPLRRVCPGPSCTRPSASPTSRTSAPAEPCRSSGVFDSAEASTASTAAGSSGRASVRRGGVSCSWACMAARLDCRANGADPDRHVWMMQASE